MSTTSPSKCSQSHCTFETDDAATLAGHLSNSSSSGTRWQCPGVGCGTIYCTCEDFDGEDGHFEKCAPFKKWNKKMKYGKTMSGRMEAYCQTSTGELEGTVDSEDAELTPTSKRKRGEEAEFWGKKVGSINKRRKAGISPAAKIEEEGEAEAGADEHGEEEVEVNGDGEAEPDELETSDASEPSIAYRNNARRNHIANAEAKSQTWGCTICDIALDTLQEAHEHIMQTNKDMSYWECMGCGERFCESEKTVLTDHFEECGRLKDWMKSADVAWPRRTDSNFINMADKKSERAGRIMQDKLARTIGLKHSRASSNMVKATPGQPANPSAVWNSNSKSWHGDQIEDGTIYYHEHRLHGFMYRPGTLTTIPPGTVPPAQSSPPSSPTRLMSFARDSMSDDSDDTKDYPVVSRREIEDARSLFGLTPLSADYLWDEGEAKILGD